MSSLYSLPVYLHPLLCSGCLFLHTTQLEQPPCAPLSVVTQHLQQQWKEHLAAIGSVTTGAVALYVSENGETWTLMYVSPDGIACVFASGEKWRRTED